ncbi:MAG: cellulase family glycosylhydrolase [bacterium]|nr:cellulase family glycosylhydrolase [candidate division KSB1 bacterium]MDH7561273.1 cellulase family glycosylhydrolase [bacterium]
MPRVRRWTFLAVAVSFWLVWSAPASSFLRQKGRVIVDATGQEVLLRGFGLGGWLVPEGYQLHIPGFGSPSFIRNRIADLLGEAQTEEFFRLYTANYVTEKDIAQIAAWGFNSVRLPFHYRLLWEGDHFREEGFQLLDQVIAWCKAHALYLILDMHCAPGGQNKDNISDSDGVEARLWTDPANQDLTVAIWRAIAARYAEEPWVGGYDLLNEPVLPTGHASSELRLLYMRLAQAIREVDNNHLLFIEGNWYSTDFTSLTPPFDGNMAYAFHKYWNENSREAILPYLRLRSHYNVPLWLGETGENSNVWLRDCLRLMEEEGIGWSWWTHKKVETTTSPYSAPISPLYQRVLDYWAGTASRPSREYAAVALMEMARSLRIDSCQFRPDIHDALTRPDHDARAIPLRAHTLPGVIGCADYDLGALGVAYYDRDYQNTGGPGGPRWNRGGAYRNDGVDIEPCSDPGGPPYSLGWLEAGEWLQYTVTVLLAGDYEVKARVAAPSGGGAFELLLDGTPITSKVGVAATGGWQQWTDMDCGQASLPAGEHALVLSIAAGGFNISQLVFSFLESGAGQGSRFERVTDKVSWTRCHPNPFAERTAFSLLVLQPERVALRIFNINGGLVTTIVDGTLPAGHTTLVWDGTGSGKQRLASGLYFGQLLVGDVGRCTPLVLRR